MTTTEHTHIWESHPDGGYACTDCTETNHACHTCHRPATDANLACTSCIDHARRTLDDIREAANTPYAFQLGIKAIRYDRDTTTGSRGHDPRGSTPDQDDPTELVPLATITGVDILTILRDPTNVLEPVLDWADTWASARSENRHDANLFDYLASRITWAVNNPTTSDWHQYRAEATTIRNRLRVLVGLAHHTIPAPCTHCGGNVIQRNGDHGLEDHLTCTGCGTTWGDREQLNLANLNRYRDIPHQNPDTLVTPDEARRMLPTLKRNTLNQWIKRQLITPAGTNTNGEPTYRIGDIATRHQTPA